MIGKLPGKIYAGFRTAKDFWIQTGYWTNPSIVQIVSVVLVSLGVAGGVIGLNHLGSLQGLELGAFDQMVRWQPEVAPDSRLLVVGITESDIHNQKQWPLSDRTIAQLLKKLQQYQPKVIGLDIYRDIPYPPGHEQLRASLEAENLIAIMKADSGANPGVPPPPGIPKERIGFNDLVVDPDNVIRRNLIYVQQGSEEFYSFALRVSLKYLAERPFKFQVKPNSVQIGDAVLPDLQAKAGAYQIETSETAGWQILLKYNSAKPIAPQISLTDALEGKFAPSLVRGKIVLIGTVAPSAKDLFATPYSATGKGDFLKSGVILHAQMISQLLGIVLDNKPQFRFWPEWAEWLWLWGWSILGGILVWRFQRPLFLWLALATALGTLWGISFWLFREAVWIPVISPSLGLFGCAAFLLAYLVFYKTYHDLLTGLANRKSLNRQLKQAKLERVQSTELMAVLFLDLDRFKIINDGLGNSAGDYLLKKVAQRLRDCLPEKGKLARVGSDEFAIWLRSVKDLQQVTDLADCLQHQLNQPIVWKKRNVFTSVSIGIAFQELSPNSPTDELLRNAHIAMDKGKELGKTRHEIFVAGMRDQVVRRWQLETDLREALKRQEFQLYYQPIFCLKTGQIAGFEALVRWQSPQRGLVSPGTFISVAEETGLIVPLGEWILAEACRQMRCWQGQFPSYPSLSISVNLSSRQFLQPDLVEQIDAILKAVGLPGESLKLEITESMMMQDIEDAIALLQRLKDLGVKLSLDDFGTGFSSLNYLHRFPINTLKVDRSFVSRIDGNAESSKYTQIVRTIIMLGQNLDLDIVAEGIETVRQLEVLQSLNCEYGQGYFFSKPLPSQAATKLLNCPREFDFRF